MQDNTIIFLTCTRQESRNINQSNQWNIESVAETNETTSLTRSIAIQTSSHYLRLVSNDTYSLTIETCKTYDNILSIISMYFQEFVIINDCTDHFIHIVCLVWIIRNDLVQVIIQTVDRIFTFDQRSFFHVVLRQIAQQLTDQLQTIFFCIYSKMSNTRLR